MAGRRALWIGIVGIWVALMATGPMAMAQPAAYGTALEAPRLVVMGEAEEYVDPDTCRIWMAAVGEGPELTPVRRDVNVRTARIIEMLRRLHIPGMEIKAPSVRVEVLYEPLETQEREPRIVGYRVRQTFAVRIRSSDPEKLNEWVGLAIDAAAKAGANEIADVMFTREDDEEIRRELLARAVRNAIAKAEAMAEAAGAKVVGFWSIAEVSGYVPSAYTAGTLGRPGGAPTTIMAGRLLIRCRVQVSCKIE